tara:strand:- start:11657 stop:11968 length:312 start_codon:yes stop_codon:yes gene_type:complete
MCEVCDFEEKMDMLMYEGQLELENDFDAVCLYPQNTAHLSHFKDLKKQLKYLNNFGNAEEIYDFMIENDFYTEEENDIIEILEIKEAFNLINSLIISLKNKII